MVEKTVENLVAYLVGKTVVWKVEKLVVGLVVRMVDW